MRANAVLDDFKAERTGPLRRQITNYVRELIVSGKLEADMRLPSSQSLAARWDIAYSAVHDALARLVKEGLLTRTPRRGTFVRQREKRLACVGVYKNYDYESNPESAYFRSLCGAAHEVLSADNVRMRLWIDHRPVTRLTDEPMAEVVTACERREVQGVIAPCANTAQMKWLSKLPVPVAFGGPYPLPYAVTPDHAQFMELSLRELARLGCQSVGLISVWPRKKSLPDDIVAACERFFDLSADLKLSVRDAWVRTPRKDIWLQWPSNERYGYEQFQALWQTRPRPDGLIVNDDVAARGVIAGLLQNRVRVPDELKLVLHRNRETDLLCPMPASFVELSIRAMAQALFSQIEKQFRGEPCQRVLLPYRLLKQNGGIEARNRKDNRGLVEVAETRHCLEQEKSEYSEAKA